MSEKLYGQKCHRCADILGSSHAVEPIEWLGTEPCANCRFCQERALLFHMAQVGSDFFDPEVRTAVKAFRDGTPHRLLDVLRDECIALGAKVEWMGETWVVTDAQYDDSDMETGSHWHLTLTRTG